MSKLTNNVKYRALLQRLCMAGEFLGKIAKSFYVSPAKRGLAYVPQNSERGILRIDCELKVPKFSKTSICAILTALILFLIFYPTLAWPRFDQTQQSAPSNSATVASTQPIVPAAVFTLTKNNLANLKNKIADLFTKNYFAKPQPAKPEPPAQPTVIAKKTITVTAYSSTPDQTDSSPYITASGVHVDDGIVAANWLAFGTKVRLPEVYGDKVFVVQDRMAIRNNRKLDVWMDSRADAMDFGVKKLTVEILN